MSNEGLSIQPVLPIWAISAGFLILLSFCLWKEWRRKSKFLFLRIAALLLMMFSLLGLFLQPSWVKERKSRSIALLTPHYRPATADSLRKANPQLTFLRVPEAATYPESQVMPSYEEVLTQHSHVRFVLGDGLPAYILPEMDQHFHYFAGEQPNGIIDWTEPATFKANQEAEITGLFRARGKSKIILSSPGGAEDSVAFAAPGTHPFKLSLTPRQAGLFLYTVATQDSTGTRTHQLPVEVLAEEKLNVLFLQNYPTAETRYLKNFLIEKGHSLALRAQISKNNFRFEYANRAPLSLNRLSTEILTSFDLLLTDNESLASLSAFERNGLEASVKSGLGIVIVYNSVDKQRNGSFLSLPLKGFRSDTARLRLGASSYTFAALPATVDAAGLEPITQGSSRILSGYLNKGAGKIAFQLLQETYRLLLEGKPADYAALWSPLLERSARTKASAFQIQLSEPFPRYTDEPLSVNIIAAQPSPRLTTDGLLLPLREDAVIDDYWHGTTWAAEKGWHRFTIEQDSTAKNYYVSAPGEWQSLRLAQQQRANQIASQSAQVRESEALASVDRQPVSPLVFFLVFLLASGFLWLVPKL